ncbi:MAG: hypothetical protein EOO73_19020 [Myxococcales bacterium]|nr:MAG: hypothetical protein EOO73_19020 [Myxococcales bacterium]
MGRSSATSIVCVVLPQSSLLTTSTGCSNGTSPSRSTRILYLPADSAAWPQDVATVSEDPFVKLTLASHSFVPVSRSVTTTVTRS